MFRNYLTTAARFLLKSKVYTAINIVGLAIGITSFLLIGLYVTDEVTYDRQHSAHDRIYRVVNHAPKNNPWLKGMPAFAPQLKSELPAIENYARLVFTSGLVNAGKQSFEENKVVYADAGFHELFSFPAAHGTNRLTDLNSAIITQNVARKYFGDQNAVGQRLEFKKEQDSVASVFTVVGVLENLPSNIHFHFNILLPYREGMNVQGNTGVYAYLLLSDKAAAADVVASFPALNEKHYQAWRTDLSQTISLQPITDIHLQSHFGEEIEVNGNANVVYILSCTAVLILMIALINYVNISLVRSSRRTKEVGIRKTLGAVRRQVAGQFIIESVLVLLFAIFISLGIVQLLLPAFNAFTEKTVYLQFAQFVPLLLAIVLVSGIAASAYPALLLSSAVPAVILRNASPLRFIRATTFRNTLLMVQFAIAMFLLIATFTIWQQLNYINSRELGFDTNNKIVVRLNGPDARRQYEAIKTKIQAYPGVFGAAASGHVPGDEFDGWPYQIPASSSSSGEVESLGTTTLFVDPEYLSLMNINIVTGRGFSKENMVADEQRAVLVNQSFLKEQGWSETDAEGKTIEYFDPSARSFAQASVIGVVRDFHFQSFHSSIEPLILRLASPGTLQRESGRIQAITFETEGPATNAVINQLQQEWPSIDPSYPLSFEFMDSKIQRLYERDEKLGKLFILFSLLSIGITCLGLLGIALLTIEQRLKEIGIRKVLGATSLNLVNLFSRSFTPILLIAFAVAAPVGYWAIGTWLESFSYRVDVSLALIALAGVTIAVLVIATIALQALRASNLNPVDTLRTE